MRSRGDFHPDQMSVYCCHFPSFIGSDKDRELFVSGFPAGRLSGVDSFQKWWPRTGIGVPLNSSPHMKMWHKSPTPRHAANGEWGRGHTGMREWMGRGTKRRDALGRISHRYCNRTTSLQIQIQTDDETVAYRLPVQYSLHAYADSWTAQWQRRGLEYGRGLSDS